MRMKNKVTGDILTLPPPNKIGEAPILINGKIVEWVLYSDEGSGSVTLGDGRVLDTKEQFPLYVIALLENWKRPVST